MSRLYILLLIGALALIAFLFVKSGKSKKPKKLSSLAKLAFFLILAGVFFGENRLLGYSLIGGGLVLALIDIKRG